MNSGLGEWEQKLMGSYSLDCRVLYEAYVDLSFDEENILTRMFKTWVDNIKRGKALWRTQIITRYDGEEKVQEIFKLFRKMHIKIAGKETRGIATWRKQEESVLLTDDFLVLLYDGNKIIGISLFQTTKSAGIYSVGVYDRELFDKPVAHISQWAAILHMKKIGLKWYFIGQRPYPNDWDKPSLKEVNIGHFKEGFSTNVFPKIIMSIDSTAKES